MQQFNWWLLGKARLWRIHLYIFRGPVKKESICRRHSKDWDSLCQTAVMHSGPQKLECSFWILLMLYPNPTSPHFFFVVVLFGCPINNVQKCQSLICEFVVFCVVFLKVKHFSFTQIWSVLACHWIPHCSFQWDILTHEVIIMSVSFGVKMFFALLKG